MNAKILVFVICVEAIFYQIICMTVPLRLSTCFLTFSNNES